MSEPWGLYKMLTSGDIVIAKRDYTTTGGAHLFGAGESYMIKYTDDNFTMVIYAFEDGAMPTAAFSADDFNDIFTCNNPTDNYDYAMGIV